ncbi:MAG: type IV pilus assembly protein PilM [Candidatus Saccharimonadales bacterium]
MAMIKGVGDFFALDIGTNAIRVVQLAGSAQAGWTLQRFSHVPVDDKLTAADSDDARRKLGEIIMTAIGQAGIHTKNVAIGLPSQKTFTTVIDVPTMPENELKNSIKYQIDQYIPMSADDAQVDWALLGQSQHDPKMLEVILTSTSKAFSEERLELVEAVGLNVIAAEPDPIAMVRSLVMPGMKDAQLVIDMGEHSTDIAITFGDNPRLMRTIPTGLHTLVKATTQNLNVKEDQARQFILKFGLAQDRLDGVVSKALDSVIDGFVAELTKSTKFFQTRYPNITIGGMVLSGFTAVIPVFGDTLGAKINIRPALGSPWQRIKVYDHDKQQLAPISAEFATVVGLAMRGNE